MLSKKARIAFYDTVQKIWVLTCASVTVVSTGYIGYQMYNYLRYIKPHKKEIEERFKEELLKEGRMLQEATQQSTSN